jgi:XTP/dITP diphosphohydrolase
MATPKPESRHASSLNREPRVLYLATQNEHKVEEFQDMLGVDWDVRSAAQLEAESGQKISWDETGDSFEANARIKARTLRRLTRAAVLADDSGLAVDALNGAPGIYSSRYAGMPESTPRAEADAANTRKLLSALEKVPDADRTARFLCCLLFIDEGGQETVIEGSCEGRIARAPSGRGGFGYDPVFLVPGRGRTMAELTDAEKNMISHRAAAVGKFLAKFL